MRIVFASPEIAPLVKTGGLADVSGALPKFIAGEEFDVIAVMPFYGSIDRYAWHPEFRCTVSIPWENGTEDASLYNTHLPGSDMVIYLIEYSPFYGRNGLYGENGRDYEDNDRRFAFFCRAVMETCRALDFRPDVIHCNDWQTGLIPLYLKMFHPGDGFFQNTSVLFTIHNLAYQGLFDPDRILNMTGLPREVYNMYGAEYFGRFGFLKSGLFYSDFITTVSPRYSREIRTPGYGMGLHGLLESRKDSLTGIINGVDYKVWDPATDPLIKWNYSKDDPGNKKRNREWLCSYCGLESTRRAPLLGMITRLTEQKGMDILAAAMDELMSRDLKFVLLGTGDEYFHDVFSGFAGKYSGGISVLLRYDEELAHMIYAGSDIFLMPSKFEPCGLSQLVSLKYGTIPVVRETGGLADTIADVSITALEDSRAKGFVFSDYSAEALVDCIDRALELYADSEEWQLLVYKAMNRDFSWKASAEKYRDLYRELYRRKPEFI